MTFRCEACGREFKYGNRRTNTSRTNWKRYVLDRHAPKCPNQIALKDICKLHG